MALSQKERRLLREINGPRPPWFYEKQREARRKEAALLADIVLLCSKHRLNLDSFMEAVKSFTTRNDAPGAG
jgi:hypothetical protein